MPSQTPSLGIPYALPNDPQKTFPTDVSQPLAERLDDTLTNLDTRLDQAVRMSISNYTYTNSLSSNVSATVTVPHGLGEVPATVIAQVTQNARLVVAVKSFTTTQVTIELFNPSPSASSSSCIIQLIAFKAIS